MSEMMENVRKWKVQDLGHLAGNSLKAILKGEFLFRLNIGRWFIHIAYTFFLFAMVIWVSLMIESTLGKVERNKATLRELEIAHSQKIFEMEALTRRTSVEERLKDMGSPVQEATKPATIIVR